MYNKNNTLFIYCVFYFAFLYIPVLLLPIFSFNDSFHMVFPLKGFTFDWYIEMCKIRLLNQSYKLDEKKAILRSLISTLEELLRLAHPIMPFITEEIWQQFKTKHKNKSSSIMISKYPSGNSIKATKEVSDIEWVKEIVSGIRNIRGEMKIKPSLKIAALFQEGDNSDKKRLKEFGLLVTELSGLSSVQWVKEDGKSPASAINFYKNLKIMIPLEGLIKPTEEKERIEKNIIKLTRESESISNQLNNDLFIKKAPSELIKEHEKRFKEISQKLLMMNIQLLEIKKLL